MYLVFVLVSGTELLIKPWNFLSDEGDKGATCYANEITSGHHLTTGLVVRSTDLVIRRLELSVPPSHPQEGEGNGD